MSRQSKCEEIRNHAKNRDCRDPPSPNRDNDEEDDARHERNKYRNYIANYSKSLPHFPKTNNSAGEVNPDGYENLRDAVIDGDPADIENVSVGSKRLDNPLAAVAFDLEGLDSYATHIPPAPRIDGREAAGEMAELYWMAYCRDVNFRDFDTDARIGNAVTDLSTNYTDFPVPRNGNTFPVTRQNVFRGFTSGDSKGPYISQFLLIGNKNVGQTEKDGYITYGSLRIDQHQLTVQSGTQSDYLKTYDEWLDNQNGNNFPSDPTDFSCRNKYDTTARRFIRNMRDLANYVHYDDLPQAFINACLILLHFDPPCVNPRLDFDPQNPYVARYNKQDGVGTFGPQHIISLVSEVTTRALKAAWYHKWVVHRRLRPEAFGGLIDRQKNTNRPPPAPNPDYPINDQILNSAVLNTIFTTYNTYLLPQAFPEGSPTHPSYPSGHATVAGACVTVLKAFFKEDYDIPIAPVRANADGTALEDDPSAGTLKVGDELNKLASNIAIGRNISGVHYRSDYTQGLLLGEQVALSILKDQEETYRERYCIRFHKFDGSTVKTGNDCP